MADEQSINIPQLVIVLVLGGLAIKYLFFTTPVASTARPRGATIRAREQDVEQIQSMFPQVGRRLIMWDLQRNGGNMAVTTERILSGRGLEEPPVTFQPPMPVQVVAPSTSAASSSSAKPVQPDLISRYNLGARLDAKAEEDDLPPPSGKQAWSQNKAERQALMKRRREEMILAARKKMEAKIAAEAAAKTKAS